MEIPVSIDKEDGKYILDTTWMLEAVYLAKDRHRLPDTAASAQAAIAKGLCEMAVKVASDRKLDVIRFSGGVAYNDAIISTARIIAEEEGFEFVTQGRRNKPGAGDDREYRNGECE